MKLTKARLKQIIKEEIEAVLEPDQRIGRMQESVYRVIREELVNLLSEQDPPEDYGDPEDDGDPEDIDVDVDTAVEDRVSHGHGSHVSTVGAKQERYGEYDEGYRQEIMQHFIDNEGMDEDEALWAVNEIDPGRITKKGRSMHFPSGVKYSPNDHYLDTYDAWQEKQQQLRQTIKPPDTSSIAPKNRRLYGSDIHGYQTHMTESVPK